MAGLKERMREGKKACVPGEKRRPKIVAVRLRCNIASSCHILLPFRLNSRRCRPEDKDDVEDTNEEVASEGETGKGEHVRNGLSSPLLALTQATIYSVSG